MQADTITVSPRKLVGVGGKRGYMQLQVQGPASLFYGNSASEITNNSSNASQQKGFAVIATDGIQRFWLDGELWVVASADCPIVWDIKYF